MLASSWWYLVASFAASWYGVAAAASENGEAYNETERGGRICRSVDIRNFVGRFERLRGCRVVEGFIQVLLVSIQEEDFGSLSFPELHEVTDYVLLYRVQGLRSLGQLFPNLKVIRGKQLFHNYALVVYEMPHLQEAGLYSLKVISRGGVRIEKNPALCYVRTVDWNRLSDWEHFIKDNKKERECPECQQCDGGLCWNNLHCQNGAVEDDCHETCLGGCTGPGPQDCLVCKDIFVDGACTTSCPPNRFEYMGRRCVTSQQCRSIPPSDINQLKECEMESSKMKKWIPFAGRCTQGCPSGYQILDDTECVPCVGHCHKFCGEGGVLDVSSVACIQSLRECTYINGSLSIQLGAGGPTIMEELEEISVNIEEIDGFLKISRSFPLVSLNFLKNLKVIHGNQLEGNKSALIVWDNPKLERLWLWDNMSQGLEIRNGRLLFHDNPRLCMSEVDKLQNITGLSNYTNVEVARESNGDRAICNSISLNVTLSIVNSTSVLIQWSNLEYSGKQTLLGYKVHYKEAPTNVSVDDLDEESCWGDNWKVNYIMINSDLQDVNRSSETLHVIGSLKAYTRYAYFVESYTMAWEIEGVQTPIQYFTTHPYRPYIPRKFKVHPKSSSEFILSWEPPLINNGRLTHYIVAGKFCADSESSVVERDFCEQTTSPSKSKVTPPPNTLVGSPPPPVNKTCCAAEEKRICTHDDDNQQFNFIFQEGTAKPDKELCGQPSTLYSVLYSNGLFADEGGIENYQTMYGAMFNNESEDFFKVENPIGFNYTHNTTGIKAAGGTYIYFIQRVNANSLSTTLTDLRHFSEYSLKIVACRAPYENEPDDNWFRVRCSPAGLKHARTRSLYGADDINSTTVVVDIPEKWSTSVRVTWEPPLNPNGLVLNYDVVYRRTDIEHHVPIKLCVSRDRFEGLGRWVWLRNVPPGDYEVRVRAISLYGSGGFTSPIYFKSRRPEFDSTPSNLIIAFSCIGALLAFGAVFGVLMWRKLKREKMKQKLLYTIANPEYISLGAYVEDEWEVVRDKIELVKELSRGSFGTVYEGILYPAKVRCAVKTVNDKASISERLEFLNEASVMKSFTEAHHVVKLLGVVSRGQPPLVIMELMTNGDLKTYLRSIRGDASREPKFERLIRMSVEIADGMAYLEASKFVHRDLAARNCMVAEDLTVKIGDFGMTRDIYETDYYRKESKGLVPVRWMSPESLADGVFTEKSDVWSYGVVLWEISTLAEQPYQGMSNEQVMQFVLDGGCLTRPVFCHPLLHHLMAGCWRKKPTHRPTFIQILGKFDSSATMRSADDFRQVSFFHSEAGLELWSKFDLRAQEDELIQLLTNSDTSSSSGGYFQP